MNLAYDANGKPIKEGDLCVTITPVPAWVTKRSGIILGSTITAQHPLYYAPDKVGVWEDEEGVIVCRGSDLMKITPDEQSLTNTTNQEVAA